MRSTPLAEGEPWPRLCAAELGGLRRLRRKHGCKSFRVELKVLSGRRTGLRAPPPPPPAAPPPAWEPRSAALGAAAASAFPAAPPPPPPAARPPPPPPPAASPRPRPGEASGVSPEIKALQQTRRLLANARERTRVHTISAAFEALRKQVPCYSYGQKLSKLAILRIACNYILSLARLADLDYSADHSNMSFSECVEQCTRTLQAEGRSKKRKVCYSLPALAPQITVKVTKGGEKKGKKKKKKKSKAVSFFSQPLEIFLIFFYALPFSLAFSPPSI
ncbi:transcription factor ATOH8 isoform X1 [Calonectris borealis]|uniref:transcription factor ATOH8 isoform X1 n=1 Tax=Calonectris borealis TaxID=1323832 RepID=UPI003F4C0503